MAASIVSGRDVAREMKDDLRQRVGALAQRGVTPGLAAVLVGDHPESIAYVSMKEKDCASIGVRSWVHRVPADAGQAALMGLLSRLSGDGAVHGILLQHPLPPAYDEDAAIRAIDVGKDIDGLTPASFGELVVGQPLMVSPTALGAMALLRATGTKIRGKRAVVIGRSNIVGKPAAWLLIREDATVTICHSKTVDLPEVTRGADILIAAIGRAEYIRAEHVKPGAVVIDCGYNRVEGRKGDVGDVDFTGVSEVASWISPVPGGVGPAGRAALIANCVLAAENRVRAGRP